MKIKILGYHTVSERGSFFLKSTDNDSANKEAKIMGISGQLYCHYGYVDNDKIDHIVSVEEV